MSAAPHRNPRDQRGREWNLGKAIPKPSSKKDSPSSGDENAPNPFIPRRRDPNRPSADAARRPKPTPRSEESGRPSDSLESASSLPSGGLSAATVEPSFFRPVRNPRTLREYLNHPLALVFVGVVFCVLLLQFLFRHTPGVSGGPTAAPPEPSESIAAYLGMGGSELAPGMRSLESAESRTAREGRLLVSAGQILLAAARFMELRETQSSLLIDAYQFVPPAIAQAPIVGSDERERFYAEASRQDAAYQSILLGHGVIESATETNRSPSDLRSVGKYLETEGLALIERSGDDRAILSLSGTRGAGNRLEAMKDRPDEETVRSAIEALFPSDLSIHLLAIRVKIADSPSGDEPKTP